MDENVIEQRTEKYGKEIRSWNSTRKNRKGCLNHIAVWKRGCPLLFLPYKVFGSPMFA